MPINHFWLNLALLSLCTRCLSPLWLLCSVPVCSARPNEKEWAEPLLKHFSNIFVHFPEFNSHTAHCYACAYNTLVVWSVCLCVFSLDFFFRSVFSYFCFYFFTIWDFLKAIPETHSNIYIVPLLLATKAHEQGRNWACDSVHELIPILNLDVIWVLVGWPETSTRLSSSSHRTRSSSL